jgi:hypothetical protein
MTPLLQSLEEIKRRGGKPKHMLKGVLPQGSNFPANVPCLIEELADKLKIPKEELDKSEASLAKIDAKVKRLGRRKSLEPPMFSALVAYVGEVMKAATDGEWEMLLAADGETWEPWVVANGRYFNPFVVVYDELYEQSPFSIQGATGGEIWMGGKPKPGSQKPRIPSDVVFEVSHEHKPGELRSVTNVEKPPKNEP